MLKIVELQDLAAEEMAAGIMDMAASWGLEQATQHPAAQLVVLAPEF